MSDTNIKKPNIVFRLLALLVTIALVLGALVLVVYRDKLNLDALERWLTARQLETGESGLPEPFTHAGGDELSLAFLSKGILFSSLTGTHYYAVNGAEYAGQVLSMDAPVLTAGAKSGAVYDAGGQSIFLFREGAQTADLTLSGNADVLSVRTNDAGWVAVTAQQSGYKGAVTVYNAEGEKAIQISLSSTFVVDAAISPDSKTVAVLTIDQESGSFHSRVWFYPVNRTEPSAKLDLGNVVVLDMDFESDRLFLLCNDRLLTTDVKAENIASYAFGHQHLKGYSLRGDGFALLLMSSYETGSADTALTLDKNCTVSARLPLSGQILDFDCAGTYTALLTGSELTVYDPMLVEKSLLSDTQSARYVSLRADGAAALAHHQQCWLYIPE